MSMLGTDMMAVACILGGAAVSGGVTLAGLAGHSGHDARCAVEAVAITPRVLLSGDGGVHTVVVNPAFRVRGVRGCAEGVGRAVRIHVDTEMQKELQAEIQSRIQREMERAQVEMERAQAEMERAQVGRERAHAEVERALREVERALASGSSGTGGGLP